MFTIKDTFDFPIYYKNGNKKMITRMKNGKTIMNIHFDINGNLLVKNNYKDDKIIKSKIYDKNGNAVYRMYMNNNNKKEIIEMQNPLLNFRLLNGQLYGKAKFIANLFFNCDDAFNEVYKLVSSEEKYDNENYIECNFENNILNGVYEEYKNSELILKCNYKNNNLDGEYIKYHKTFVFGIIDICCIEYKQLENVIEKRNYENNKILEINYFINDNKLIKMENSKENYVRVYKDIENNKVNIRIYEEFIIKNIKEIRKSIKIEYNNCYMMINKLYDDEVEYKVEMIMYYGDNIKKIHNIILLTCGDKCKIEKIYPEKSGKFDIIMWNLIIMIYFVIYYYYLQK